MLRRNSKQGVAASGLRLLLAFYFCWTAAARANDNADLLNVVVGDQDLFGANDAPGLLDEAIVEDERAFFLKHDVDGDGKLNFDEFNKHWEARCPSSCQPIAICATWFCARPHVSSVLTRFDQLQ